MENRFESDILVYNYKTGASCGETTTRQKFYEAFQKNWNMHSNGWARSFGTSMEEALEKCIKAWFV